jgi:hypothetical protein
VSALPADLDRLGSHLEAAAARSLRRRARRQAVLNAVCAVALAVPLAIAVSATSVAPSDVTSSARGTFAAAVLTPATSFHVRHIPEEWLPTPVYPRCLDANDCRVAAPTQLFHDRAPARRA